MLSIRLQYSIIKKDFQSIYNACFLLLLLFTLLHPPLWYKRGLGREGGGGTMLSVPIKTAVAAARESNHRANGWRWQKEGHERGGPIRSLDYWLHPTCKRLRSVSLLHDLKASTPLNQKSMKSLGYIFGLSCQHFKFKVQIFFFIEKTCRAKKNKNRQSIGEAEIWQLTEKYHP